MDPSVRAATPYRLAHVVTHPIHYFAPLYRNLAARPEIDLTVYFCSDVSVGKYRDPELGRTIAWSSDLLSGYKSRFVPSAIGSDLRSARRRFQYDLFRALVDGEYDGIWLHGYAYPTAWLTAIAAAVSGSTLLMREEQTLVHRRPATKRALKQVFLRGLLHGSKGLYIGEANRRYLKHYGIADSALFFAPYAVDNDWFQQRALELGPKCQLRAQVGIDDEAPVILFVGKLIDKKQPLALLRAFQRVRAQASCWLVLVGDGPLRQQVDHLVEHARIPNVIQCGFVNQDALPQVYALADIFVLPSNQDETWGLVVNEALNFALPVLVSDKVGCGADLVEDGLSGYIFPAGDIAGLSSRLAQLVRDGNLRREMGRRGREIVSGYTIERSADGIFAACLADRARTKGHWLRLRARSQGHERAT